MSRISVENEVASVDTIIAAIRDVGQPLRESDIASITRIHRRTVNNYLRSYPELFKKEGFDWSIVEGESLRQWTHVSRWFKKKGDTGK